MRLSNDFSVVNEMIDTELLIGDYVLLKSGTFVNNIHVVIEINYENGKPLYTVRQIDPRGIYTSFKSGMRSQLLFFYRPQPELDMLVNLRLALVDARLKGINLHALYQLYQPLLGI